MAMDIDRELKEVEKKIEYHFGQISTLKKYRKSLEITARMKRKVEAETDVKDVKKDASSEGKTAEGGTGV